MRSQELKKMIKSFGVKLNPRMSIYKLIDIFLEPNAQLSFGTCFLDSLGPILFHFVMDENINRSRKGYRKDDE